MKKPITDVLRRLKQTHWDNAVIIETESPAYLGIKTPPLRRFAEWMQDQRLIIRGFLWAAGVISAACLLRALGGENMRAYLVYEFDNLPLA